MWRNTIVFVLCAGLGATGGAYWKSRVAAGAPDAVTGSGVSRETPARVVGRAGHAEASPLLSAAGRAKAGASAGQPPSLEELRAAAEKDRLPLLVRWLAAADAAQVEALAREWFPAGRDSGDARWQVLAARWVELDAAGAIGYGRKLAEEVRRVEPHIITPLYFVYMALGKVDRQLALSFLASEPPGGIGKACGALTEVLGAEAMRDWALAQSGRPELEFLRHLDVEAYTLDFKNPAESAARLSPALMHFHGASLAGEWAKTDPLAALDWARGVENGLERSKLLAAVATSLAASDPEKAREIIQSLPPGPPRANAGAAYAAVLAKKDPQAAEVWAKANLQGAARLQSLAAIAGVQAESDPAAALRLLRENGIGDLGRHLNTQISSPVQTMQGYAGDSAPLRELFKTLGAKDPAATMQLLADTGSLVSPPGWLRSGEDAQEADGYIGRAVLKEWAAKDPAAAARWAAAQAAGGVMSGLNRSVAEAWFSKNPGDLQAFAASLPAGAAKDEWVGATASLISVQDPAGALAWAAGKGGDGALGTVFASIAQSNPAVAAERFASLPETVQASQLQVLTDSLGKTSPVSAVSFYQSLPEERQASVRLRETAVAYARQDPQAASEWIGSLPPTEARDTAISGLVDYLLQVSSDPDPESAAHWAAASIDADGRGRRLERVAKAWFQRDPDGAAAAIRAATLAPEVKQTLLSHAPPK